MTRTLHIDCFSGISGDMMVAALIDLAVPESILQQAVQSLELGATLNVQKVRKSGFAATKADVVAPPEHAHRHLSHIHKILDRGSLSERARALAKRMFDALGAAEAAAHGIPVDKVHFHEVGAVDSICDIAAVAVGVDWLGADRITSRPPPTGTGFIDCEHGRLPIPAPAVARLLTGAPLAPCAIESELTTPTGATVLAVLVNQFVAQPAMTIEKIGVGAGTRDLPQQPNVLRLFWGTSNDDALGDSADVVWQVDVNLDDVAAEIIGYAQERLFAAGALDVWTCPIQMKKNRPATLLSALCDDAALPEIERVIFEETGTMGLRRHRLERSKLERRAVTIQTPWGPVKGKLGRRGSLTVVTPEFEDCARLAREQRIPLRSIYQAARERHEPPEP